MPAVSGFVRAARSEDVPEGSGKLVEAGGRCLALFRLDGAFFALDNACPHRGGPLAEGSVEKGRVTCPWHAWSFDLATGKTPPPLDARVASYPVKVEAGEVLICLG